MQTITTGWQNLLWDMLMMLFKSNTWTVRCVVQFFFLFSLQLMGYESNMLLLKQIVSQATMHFDQIEGNDKDGWGVMKEWREWGCVLR